MEEAIATTTITTSVSSSIMNDGLLLTSDFRHPNTTLTRLAFGSCHKNKYANPEIWNTILGSSSSGENDEETSTSSSSSSPLQAWVWTGDAVYPPKRGVASVELLRHEYHQLATNESMGYASFVRRLQEQQNQQDVVYGTWDDHDFGANDAGNEMPDKLARVAAFWEFLGLAPPPPPHVDGKQQQQNEIRYGLYSSVTWGEPPTQVKLVLLDTRWHRDHHCIPSMATKFPLGAGIACLTRWLTAGLLPQYWCLPSSTASQSPTMLGDEQWHWLEDQLSPLKSQATIHIVVSSVQVLTTNPAMESWGQFPSERDRLIRLLSTTRNPILLSGDVHHAELLDPLAAAISSSTQQQQSPPSSFLEITSSGMTHDCEKHIYGKLCRPILESFHRHRYRGDSDSKESNHHQNYFIGRNFGSLHIDWSRMEYEVKVHALTKQPTPTSAAASSDSRDGQIVLTTGLRPIRSLDEPPPSPWTEEQYQQVYPCIDGHLQQAVLSLSTFFVGSIALFFVVRRRGGGSSQPKGRTSSKQKVP